MGKKIKQAKNNLRLSENLPKFENKSAGFVIRIRTNLYYFFVKIGMP